MFAESEKTVVLKTLEFVLRLSTALSVTGSLKEDNTKTVEVLLFAEE